jgi:outer membrane receptor protein involved in Fe transport
MARFALLLFTFAALCAAQSGQIRLEVRDPSGAGVPAKGKLSRLSAGVAQSYETDEAGKYTFTGLVTGKYRLEAAAPGFVAQAVLVDVNDEPVHLAVELSVGSETERVDVVAGTPLPGVDLLLEQISAPVQTVTERDLEQSGSVNIFDVMNRRLNSVFVNEVNGNPFQPDVNYRGYTASPLLGTPQGISVYMDGVRMNQPFGDVVSWDLIPRIAIAETALIPGSDPLFGLNTLGGAMSIRTKDGLTHAGNTLQLTGGSFGRRTAEFEHGGAKGAWNWYGATNLFFEDGWRDYSPSNVRQFIGKLGWQGEKTMFGVMGIYANNQLNGSGLQEQSFLARDYDSLYTIPDVFKNRSPLLNFTGRHSFSENVTFFGNAYYRYVSTHTFNADINEESLDQSLYQPSAAERAVLAAAGYTNIPASGLNASNTPFPFYRCLANGFLGDEPSEKCNGLLNRGDTRQHNGGFSGQVTWLSQKTGHRNQFTAGGAWDRSSSDFQSTTQLGYLNADRTVTPIQAFADGVTGGDADGVPYDTRVDLLGKVRTGSLYATDTLSIGRAWDITLSGRYNHTTLTNSDRIQPEGGPGSLNGRHTFDRFNPAIGVSYHPAALFNGYVRYSESNRAPTSIELGCADPEVPCKLPNAMAGDPPLKQVVAKTWEAGYRGQAEGKARWSFGWFRAENRNDILFVSAPQTGFGYFKNFGATRRQGLEIDFDTDFWRVNLGANYTLLDATFQSAEEVNGSANSTNEEAEDGTPGVEGAIEIHPGNRIPLTPRHMGKVFADIQVTKKFTLNLSAIAFSSSLARGNENNLHEPDGTYYLGSGTSGGYVVMNLGARYQVNRRLQLFAQITNLADRRYSSGAQLGPMGFTDAGNFIARPLPAVNGEFPVRQSTFYAPGAPRTVWGGIRVSF